MSSIPHTTGNQEEIIQQALTEYRTTKYLNIDQTAQKYGIYVSDLRKAFAHYLEEKYCGKSKALVNRV